MKQKERHNREMDKLKTQHYQEIKKIRSDLDDKMNCQTSRLEKDKSSIISKEKKEWDKR